MKKTFANKTKQIKAKQNKRKQTKTKENKRKQNKNKPKQIQIIKYNKNANVNTDTIANQTEK